MTALLSIRDLRVEYPARRAGRRQAVTVIESLDLDVRRGETLAVVGESGAGKSTLAEAIVGLVRPSGGSISYDGTELSGLRGRAGRRVRVQIQMVAQNPLLALSPRQPVGAQIEEPLRVHSTMSRAECRKRADEIINTLGLSPAIRDRLPHELSGGQAQRAVLARALVLEPSMVIFDEPTSALDVSVQAGVLNLLQQLKADHGLTYLFITHDLGVARHLSDRITVMRTGTIVEQQPTETLFTSPQHPYTRSLLASSLTV